MKPLLLFVSIVLLLAPGLAAADVVTEWNQIALASATTARHGASDASRVTALVHSAIFDAVNAIEARYQPYRVKVAAPPGASAEAAAVAAGYGTLVRLYPAQKAALDTAYATSLGRIAEGAAKTGGVGVGEKVAAESFALRANDGANAPNVYRPVTTPGVYVVTVLPVSSHWPNVTPWVLQRSSQFRPGPPPTLTSSEWARDCAEVMELGSKTSTVRTAEQTDIARFWTIVGPASWDPVLGALAATPGRSLLQNARFFALAEMAAADAYIAVFDAKYTYNLWRPITAIRNGDLHGNAAMSRNPGWEPLIDTPLHPEYPCAHCITSAAIAVVIESEFGPGPMPEVTMTSPTAPNVVRRWTSANAFTDEVSLARIYGGIHYRTSMIVGQRMGRQIGEVAVQQYLKPIR
jgi:PAP2 superfamily protein